MHRIIKKAQGYFYLTPTKRPFGGVEPKGWQSFDPGETGDDLREKVRALAAEGFFECFIFTDAHLKRKICQRLPLWIRQLKTEHPQLDFHLRSGRPS